MSPFFIFRYALAVVLLILLLYEGLIIVAARRAAKASKSPLPLAGKVIMWATPLFIILSIAFILLA